MSEVVNQHEDEEFEVVGNLRVTAQGLEFNGEVVIPRLEYVPHSQVELTLLFNEEEERRYLYDSVRNIRFFPANRGNERELASERDLWMNNCTVYFSIVAMVILVSIIRLATALTLGFLINKLPSSWDYFYEKSVASAAILVLKLIYYATLFGFDHFFKPHFYIITRLVVVVIICCPVPWFILMVRLLVTKEILTVGEFSYPTKVLMRFSLVTCEILESIGTTSLFQVLMSREYDNIPAQISFDSNYSDPSKKRLIYLDIITQISSIVSLIPFSLINDITSVSLYWISIPLLFLITCFFLSCLNLGRLFFKKRLPDNEIIAGEGNNGENDTTQVNAGHADTDQPNTGEDGNSQTVPAVNRNQRRNRNNRNIPIERQCTQLCKSGLKCTSARCNSSLSCWCHMSSNQKLTHKRLKKSDTI